MLKRYETMFILKPTLTEDEIKEKVELIKDTIQKQDAEVKGIEDMGMRTLAYKIQKFERGYYTVIYFEVKPSAIKELERVYGITEDIIRFNVIKYDRKIEIEMWENMVKKANGEKVEEKKLKFGLRADRRPSRADSSRKSETKRD